MFPPRKRIGLVSICLCQEHKEDNCCQLCDKCFHRGGDRTSIYTALLTVPKHREDSINTVSGKSIENKTDVGI